MKTLVISGASGGIGQATAQKFAKEGWHVYDLSRHGEDDGQIIHITADVTDEESIKDAFERIRAREGKLDLLICNAGFGISGAAEFTSLADAKAQFDVNFFGMFLCCKYAMPLLRTAHGRIITISSAAAVFPIPFQSFYAASKAAICSFSRALRNEVHKFSVSVTSVLPGDVSTGFTAARKKETAGEEIYGGRIEASVAVMEKDEINGMKPTRIASAIYRIANKKWVRPLYTPGAKYKLFMVLDRLLGTTIVNGLLGMLYVKKPGKHT